MNLGGMIERIPSTDKILGVVWIVSWICAIWMYHIQFFLTGLFCLFLIFILLGRFDKNEDEKTPKVPAAFTMNKNTRTLTVQKIYEDGVKWEDHEICSGVAKLPVGAVKEGDIIKDCKGNLALRHIPSNTLIGGYNFEE